MNRYLKKIIKLVGLEEMRILPGNLAFSLIFLIIPFASFIGLLLSSSSIDLKNILSNNMPIVVLNIIESAMYPNPYNILLFLIISLWLSSKGCMAIIVSSNVLYKIKDNNIIKLKIKSILMIILLFILVSIMLLIILFGDKLIHLININQTIYNILKYIISIVIIFIFIKLIYFLAPSKRISSKYMNKGSIFTTLSWVFLLRLYSYYLNNYNNYDFYYGNLSNILILLLWMYLLSYLFTIGLSINVNDYLVSKLEIEKNNKK